MKDIIVIVGPTGVGKTKLSIELAKRLNAEIINGDSVSIYKDLNIGSAKPTKEEQENIPHHLIDIKEVEEDYNVYEYQKDVRKIIDEITKRGKRIILVGGTGLYIKAALYDYQFEKEKEKRDYSNLTNEEIIEKIKKLSSDEIKDEKNRRRLERLLNKLEQSSPITHNKDKCLYPIQVFGLTTDRAVLYERINHRVDKMIENGLLEEIDSLKEKYDNSRILNSAIGYKEFYDYFYKNKSLEEVVEEIKKDSRRFAKRQYTFFNHQFKTTWIETNFKDFNQTVEEVLKQIETNH
ncbi:MAG: tRNA (adenosine(37)-N6)-dimethylallyltransferase MiaA [Bacilli bacterium]|nr:tRNA (adenosine(37)-N6)-dimethylallyltransferase MiaA [Bacilli bacterium]